MDLKKAVRERHAVRRYKDVPIDRETLRELKNEIERCNRESGLHIQLITDEHAAFGGKRSKEFSGVGNYIALIGKKDKSLQEKCGYYGEHIVLTAQSLGLNTRWAPMTFDKRKAPLIINKGEKLVCLIAVGYGETAGLPHKNRSIDPLCKFKGDMPHWFMDGMEAAMLAPTALNQQKFRFTLIDGNKVEARRTGGFFSKVDLGIVKYHFELGAGKENFRYV